MEDTLHNVLFYIWQSTSFVTCIQFVKTDITLHCNGSAVGELLSFICTESNSVVNSGSIMKGGVRIWERHFKNVQSLSC